MQTGAPARAPPLPHNRAPIPICPRTAFAMAYMLLIVEPTGQRADRGLEGGQAAYARMLEYTQELNSAGVLEASNSLATQARRLQVRENRTRVLDGPFAEAREMVGGFFLLNCTDAAEALRWAERCPAAAWATVEVREVGPCYT